MPDKRGELRSELERLVKEGAALLKAEVGRQMQAGKANKESSLPNAEKAKGEPTLDSIFDLQRLYQSWYSESLRVVQQLLPDRLQEFQSLYRVDRRKEITPENYGVADYLAGITVTRLGENVFETSTIFVVKYSQQIAMLRSAESRIDSLLADIRGVLEASLFDSELEAARGLLKSKHVRSAGVIGGVVLERHLKRVIENHGVAFRKVGMLSNLNQAVKDASIIDVPQWRRIQHLADVRNLCGHSGDREPTTDEVSDMLNGVEQIIRTVF